jgi:hypothetical protein
MAGREIVNRQVNIYIQSGDAQKAYDALIKKEKALNEEIAKTTDPKRMKKLKDDLTALQEPIDRAGKKLRGEILPTMRDLEATTRRFQNEWKRTGDPAALASFQKANAELGVMKMQLTGLSQAQQGLSKKGIFSAAFWANLAATGITRATAALSGFFKSSIDEALQAEEAAARLNSTLSNLGQSDAFDRISRKAEEMARRFKYLDNDDVIAVFNSLIDYGKLTEREMNNLLPVIIDFAAKMRISLGDATSKIVKALEGNGKALKEFGIDIKDTGDETERLNIIMTTLKDKVEGSGEAFQNTAAGGIAVAKQEFANLKEEVGNGLIPILTKLLSLANKLIKPLSFIFSGRSFTSDSVKELLGQSDVQTQADENERLLNEALKENLRIAKSKGISASSVTDEFIKSIEKKYKDVEAKLKGLTAKAIFSSPADQQDRAIAAKDAAANLLAYQRFLDSMRLVDKDLGISGPTSPKDIKDTKKDIDDLAASVKNLGDVIEKELKKRSGNINADKLVGKGIDFAKGISDRIQEIAGNQNNDKLAFLELQIFGKRGLRRLQAEKNLLDEQMRQELAVVNLTENQKELIRKRYLERKQELERQFASNFVEELAGYAQAALNISNVFSQINTQRENAELERDRSINERKKSNLEKRLNAGKISRANYDREISRLDAEQEKREKAAAIRQFNSNKRANIAQATIDGIMAVSQVIRTVPKLIPGTVFPNPQFPIILAETIGMKLATIALIAAQKPPKLAKGGMLGGRLHSEGGNAIVDGQGNKIAEIERGEGVVNRHTMGDDTRYTVTGTPSQITSRLNSLHGGVHWAGGAVLTPAWSSRSPMPFNFSAIRRYYAGGGTFDTAGAGGSAAGASEETMQQLMGLLVKLDSTLNHPIMAVTSLKQHLETEQRYLDILDDATLK